MEWYARNLKSNFFFYNKLCYHASHETIWLQKEEPSRGETRKERSQKLFLDGGSQDCRIISVKETKDEGRQPPRGGKEDVK